MSEGADVLIVGAGIAGSSLAFELAEQASVLLLERETLPGYHSTGRSAAMLIDTYGTDTVRRLTRASRPFLEHPPAGFADQPLLSPRGTLHIARADQRPALERAWRLAAPQLPSVHRLSGAEVRARMPLIRASYVAGGLLEPEASAIDVAALHQAYLRGLRRRGGRLVTDAKVKAIKAADGGWRVETTTGAYRSEVLVDAAGAWADQIALMAGVPPIGLIAKRRTAVLIDPPDGFDSAWPMVIDIDERFYFKPEAGQLLLSPADETPLEPSDVQAEELDVALAVERYQRVTGQPVRRLSHRWAGLRSFVADQGPVVGPDPAAPGFVWLAGQGGFGIMTAPALARICARLITESRLPPEFEIEPTRLTPGRLRRC
jgi:D-arginine dehydrogenase